MAYPHMRDRCDYKRVLSEFDQMFRRGRKCIVSADLDGLLSGVLMGHLLDWEVVGTYDGSSLHLMRECLPSGTVSIETVLTEGAFLFLDHDIYRQDIDSIGHHMLAWSQDIPIPLHTEGRSSLNPNLLRGIVYNKEFDHKYPFSTFHFLFACASAWGWVNDFHPDDEMTTLLLHIDSSFVNAINYQANALGWLDWLGGSEEASPLYPICRRMLRFTPRTIFEQFRNLKERLSGFELAAKPGAALVRPDDPGAAKPVREFVGWIEQETGWHGRILISADTGIASFTVDRNSKKPLKREFEPVIAREPFSYAILNLGEHGLNFGWLENA